MAGEGDALIASGAATPGSWPGPAAEGDAVAPLAAAAEGSGSRLLTRRAQKALGPEGLEEDCLDLNMMAKALDPEDLLRVAAQLARLSKLRSLVLDGNPVTGLRAPHKQRKSRGVRVADADPGLAAALPGSAPIRAIVPFRAVHGVAPPVRPDSATESRSLALSGGGTSRGDADGSGEEEAEQLVPLAAPSVSEADIEALQAIPLPPDAEGEMDLRGVRALAAVVARSTTLISLSLAGCRLTDWGAHFLASALARNGSLVYLDLRDCSLAARGKLALAAAIGGNARSRLVGLRLDTWHVPVSVAFRAQPDPERERRAKELKAVRRKAAAEKERARARRERLQAQEEKAQAAEGARQAPKAKPMAERAFASQGAARRARQRRGRVRGGGGGADGSPVRGRTASPARPGTPDRREASAEPAKTSTAVVSVSNTQKQQQQQPGAADAKPRRQRRRRELTDVHRARVVDLSLANAEALGAREKVPEAGLLRTMARAARSAALKHNDPATARGGHSDAKRMGASLRSSRLRDADLVLIVAVTMRSPSLQHLDLTAQTAALGGRRPLPADAFHPAEEAPAAFPSLPLLLRGAQLTSVHVRAAGGLHHPPPPKAGPSPGGQRPSSGGSAGGASASSSGALSAASSILSTRSGRVSDGSDAGAGAASDRARHSGLSFRALALLMSPHLFRGLRSLVLCEVALSEGEAWALARAVRSKSSLRHLALNLSTVGSAQAQCALGAAAGTAPHLTTFCEAPLLALRGAAAARHAGEDGSKEGTAALTHHGFVRGLSGGALALLRESGPQPPDLMDLGTHVTEEQAAILQARRKAGKRRKKENTGGGGDEGEREGSGEMLPTRFGPDPGGEEDSRDGLLRLDSAGHALRVSLPGLGVMDHGAIAVAQVLATAAPALTSLDLRRNRLTARGVAHLAAALRGEGHCWLRLNQLRGGAGAGAVTELDLSGNAIGAAGATALATAWSQDADCDPEALTRVRAAAEAGAAAGAGMAEGKGKGPCPVGSLRQGIPDAAYGYDTEPAAAAVAHARRIAPQAPEGQRGPGNAFRQVAPFSARLCVLRLDDASLGPVGAVAVADSLAACPALAHVSARGNQGGVAAGLAFARLVRTHPSLQSLDLSRNGLASVRDEERDLLRAMPHGAVALITAAAASRTLSRLSLRYNGLGAVCAGAVAEAVAGRRVKGRARKERRYCALTSLDVALNDLRAEDWRPLPPRLAAQARAHLAGLGLADAMERAAGEVDRLAKLRATRAATERRAAEQARAKRLAELPQRQQARRPAGEEGEEEKEGMEEKKAESGEEGKGDASAAVAKAAHRDVLHERMEAKAARVAREVDREEPLLWEPVARLGSELQRNPRLLSLSLGRWSMPVQVLRGNADSDGVNDARRARRAEEEREGGAAGETAHAAEGADARKGREEQEDGGAVPPPHTDTQPVEGEAAGESLPAAGPFDLVPMAPLTAVVHGRMFDLRRLVLRSVGLRCAEAIVLGKLLEGNAVAQALDVGDNAIGVEGAVALAGALRWNRSLTEVDLSGNDITQRGTTARATAALGEVLTPDVNSVVHTVSLARCALTDETARPFVEAWRVNRFIASLDVHGNRLSDAWRQYLLDSSSKHRAVRVQ